MASGHHGISGKSVMYLWGAAPCVLAPPGHTRLMKKYCCDRMKYDITQICDQHADRNVCPDALVAEVRGGFGLIIHDGGHSVIEIHFCPWCGTKLPPIGYPTP
jgi:hypothetical protein